MITIGNRHLFARRDKNAAASAGVPGGRQTAPVRAVAGLCAVVVLGAACSGSDEGADTTTPNTPPSASVTTPSTDAAPEATSSTTDQSVPATESTIKPEATTTISPATSPVETAATEAPATEAPPSAGSIEVLTQVVQ